MRTLLYVPMIHREDECADPVTGGLPAEQAALREAMLDNYWELVTELVMLRADELERNGGWPPAIDVFCEGALSTRNFEILSNFEPSAADLVPRLSMVLATLCQDGARMHATESRLAYGIHALADISHLSHLPGVLNAMIYLRDRCIARALGRGVPEGGTAVLFVGASHDVPAYLGASWEVVVITAAEIPVLLRQIDRRPLTWVELYRRQDDRHRISEDEMAEEEL